MNHIRQFSVIALCFVRLLVACSAAPAEQTQMRVAVVDTGDKPAVPTELLDLLLVHLSQEANLELLERQEVAALFREQQHSLVFAGDKAKENIVATGQLLGADALVLLSADRANEEGIQAIEARIVETRRGIRFGETTIVWSETEPTLSDQLQSATKQLINRLLRVKNAEGKETVVSFPGFRTNEQSHEAHRVRRNIESWLETWLSSQPGIVVAERTEVLPLVEERRLSQDLPESLGEADAVVDGRFQLNFTQQAPQLELTVRVIRKDRAVAEQTLHGPLTTLPEIQHHSGRAILKLLSQEVKSAPFDSVVEAKLLTDNAERMFLIGRNREAARQLTAAYALQPDDNRAQVLLLRVGVCDEFDNHGKVIANQFYPQALLLSDVAYKVVDQLRLGRKQPGKAWYYRDDSVLETVFSLCRRIASLHFDNQFEPPTAAEHEWFRASIEKLYLKCLAMTESKQDKHYLRTLRLGMECAPYWSETPKEALAMRRELLDRAYLAIEKHELFVEVLAQCGMFRLDGNLTWKNNRELPKLYKDYLQELATSDRPFYRARAARGMAEWAIQNENDREQAVAHYQHFIDILIDDVVPSTPKYRYVLGDNWLDYYYIPDHFLTDDEAGEYWSRVIRACWSSDCPRASQPWEHRIALSVARLENAGRIKQAKLLLQECINKLEAAEARLRPKQKQYSQWPRTAARLQILLSELIARHPESIDDGVVVDSLAVACQPSLTIQHLAAEISKAEQVFFDDLQKFNPSNRFRDNTEFDRRMLFAMNRFWYFLGMTPTAEGYAVICGREKLTPYRDDSERKYSQWLLVVRLNRHGQFRSAKLHPRPIERDSTPVGELREHHLWPLASSGDDLFVAGGNGVFWVRDGDAPIHFSSKYLGKPSPTLQPAPFDNVHEIVALGKKLIVKGSSDPTKPKIYELDYRKGTSTELWDAQNLPTDSPFDRREGYSIMAGPNNNLLVWARPDITRKKRPSNAGGGDLFLVNLDNKSIRQSELPLYLSYSFYQIHGDYQPFKGIVQSIGYGSPEGELAIFDPRNAELKWFVNSDLVKESAPKLVRAGLAANDRWLLASQKRTGNSIINDWQKYHNVIVKHGADAVFEWMLYQRDNPAPQRLTAPNLPSPGEVKQYLLDDQGQIFMMTSKEVFRIQLPTVLSR